MGCTKPFPGKVGRVLKTFLRSFWAGLIALSLTGAPVYGEEETATSQAGTPIQTAPTTLVTGQVEGEAVPFQILAGSGKSQRAYSIMAGPATEAQQAIYDRLSEEEKRAFEYKRLTTLKLLAGALNHMPRLVGFVSATGKLLNTPIGVRKKTDGPRGPPAENALPASLRDRGYRAIQALLLNVDSQLFDRAPVIANMNEYGFAAFGGLGTGAMVGSKGWGEGHGLGLYFGYSPNLKQLTLELYWGREEMQRATVALKPPAAVLKLMVSGFRRRDEGESPIVTYARGLYPILVPGVGRSFVQDSPGAAHAGWATGWNLVPGAGVVAHAFDVVPLDSSLDGWTVRATRIPLLRAYVQLPKEGKRFAVTFHTAVDFRSIVNAGWQWTRYAATAPFISTAKWCGWAMKAISGLCGAGPCAPPKP